MRGFASVAEVLEKMRNLECGLSEGCRLNQLGVARHGGLGLELGLALDVVRHGGLGLELGMLWYVALWFVTFLPMQTT